MKKERLKEIEERLGELNMSRKGLTDDSPVSQKLWDSKNDVVRLGELRWLINKALKKSSVKKQPNRDPVFSEAGRRPLDDRGMT